jgi:hypothetical protein
MGNKIAVMRVTSGFGIALLACAYSTRAADAA